MWRATDLHHQPRIIQPSHNHLHSTTLSRSTTLLPATATTSPCEASRSPPGTPAMQRSEKTDTSPMSATAKCYWTCHRRLSTSSNIDAACMLSQQQPPQGSPTVEATPVHPCSPLVQLQGATQLCSGCCSAGKKGRSGAAAQQQVPHSTPTPPQLQSADHGNARTCPRLDQPTSPRPSRLPFIPPSGKHENLPSGGDLHQCRQRRLPACVSQLRQPAREIQWSAARASVMCLTTNFSLAARNVGFSTEGTVVEDRQASCTALHFVQQVRKRHGIAAMLWFCLSRLSFSLSGVCDHCATP